jgi:tRNA(Ile)-lysidine synthase
MPVLDILPDAPLAVAVSGGADSMALACMLHGRGANVTALHVNHNLRTESAQEAEQVARWMQTLGIPCHVLTVTDDLKAAPNMMKAAREARYALMTEWCHAQGVTHLCVAHQLEDQAETFLMRLGRGSGLDGLSAMRPITQAYGLSVVRPLLHTSRAEIETYLSARGQAWLRDPTNERDNYTRNRIRRLLPALAEEGLSAARMLQATHNAARASDCLNAMTQAWIEAYITPHENGVKLPLPSFIALHEELALRVLRTLLRQVARDMHGEVRFASLEPLLSAMREPESFRTRTLHHCMIQKHENSYAITH